MKYCVVQLPVSSMKIKYYVARKIIGSDNMIILAVTDSGVNAQVIADALNTKEMAVRAEALAVPKVTKPVLKSVRK